MCCSTQRKRDREGPKADPPRKYLREASESLRDAGDGAIGVGQLDSLVQLCFLYGRPAALSALVLVDHRTRDTGTFGKSVSKRIGRGCNDWQGPVRFRVITKTTDIGVGVHIRR